MQERGFFEGRFGRYILPGVILQSVLIGGGYATGREIVEFGAKYGALGWLAGLAIFAGFAGMAFLTFEVARRFQAFDYRSLLKHVIGPFYPLYDIVYVLLAILVIAIMAAATGEILNSTLGLNYWVGVVLIIIVVGILNFYGEGLIERFKTAGTALLYLGYITFAFLVISRNWDQIGTTLSSGDHSLHPDAGLGIVLWTGIIYVGYNLVVYPAALFTVRRQTSMRDSVVAALFGGVLMTFPWFLTYFALMGFYPDDAIFDASVPWLEMLSSYGGWMLVVFGIVVGWTLIETATGVIYALLARVNQNLVDLGRKPLSRRANGAISVVALLLALVLARVGIIDLIAKGYTAMGYAMIAVFALPMLIRGTYLIVTGRGQGATRAPEPAYD
ncbi:YkvI family membrane protein [Sphaerobacter thermophilus]|uniref:Uncharacterized membrane protein-like protein n=1 Tax=Sphaerobacter thermophilus (strain ATCC 49802 / DSM 20745 / KCCM 41009 / NCIMB 13125 / S 6022) TaxID=479434 RepID=D1CA10_SPHTD|nr:membrane protein [Sphaerobacter thermophilus]ACZ40653.1 Uncharacterized membrane protein-like protein [Sphaerobacter thermophilus DSM 20745]